MSNGQTDGQMTREKEPKPGCISLIKAMQDWAGQRRPEWGSKGPPSHTHSQQKMLESFREAMDREDM